MSRILFYPPLISWGTCCPFLSYLCHSLSSPLSWERMPIGPGLTLRTLVFGQSRPLCQLVWTTSAWMSSPHCQSPSSRCPKPPGLPFMARIHSAVSKWLFPYVPCFIMKSLSHAQEVPCTVLPWKNASYVCPLPNGRSSGRETLRVFKSPGTLHNFLSKRSVPL